MTKKDILDYLYKYQEVFGILISLGSWFTEISDLNYLQSNQLWYDQSSEEKEAAVRAKGFFFLLPAAFGKSLV